MNLCKDCKHYRRGGWVSMSDGCAHPMLADAVTGKPVSAAEMRMLVLPIPHSLRITSACGPNGAFWESK